MFGDEMRNKFRKAERAENFCEPDFLFAKVIG